MKAIVAGCSAHQVRRALFTRTAPAVFARDLARTAYYASRYLPFGRAAALATINAGKQQPSL